MAEKTWDQSRTHILAYDMLINKAVKNPMGLHVRNGVLLIFLSNISYSSNILTEFIWHISKIPTYIIR